MDEVLSFISRFTKGGKRTEVVDAFTDGCCYWFAQILSVRFPQAQIMYDPIIGHFVVSIGDNLYDVTGCVTGEYHPLPWDETFDALEKDRIIKYCVNF